MKKLTTLILALALILAPAALAEIDLSGMSFDELVDLQRQITAAIMQTDEWQEVEVPAGTYVVGDDIPAGRWTIKAATDEGSAVTLAGPNNHPYYAEFLDLDENVAVNWTFEDGMTLEIEYGPAIFTPYTAAFSFK